MSTNYKKNYKQITKKSFRKIQSSKQAKDGSCYALEKWQSVELKASSDNPAKLKLPLT